MVTHTGRPGAQKRPALSGGTYQYVRNGRLITAKWPRKRGKPNHPATREQNAWFREANRAAKFVDSAQQWMAQTLSKDGPLYPRDLIMSAMAGQLHLQLLIDGEVWTSMALVNDISKDLDLLAGDTPGTIMWRGPQRWQGLSPPSENAYLQYDVATGALDWVEAVPSSRWNIATCGGIGSIDSGSTNCHGNMFRARENFTIAGGQMYIDLTINRDYRFFVAEVSQAGVIQSVLAESDTWEANFSGNYGVYLTLTTPAQCVGFNYYVAGFYMPDQLPASPLDAYRASNHGLLTGLPIQMGRINGLDVNRVILADNNPQTGDAFTVLTTSTAAMSLHWYP